MTRDCIQRLGFGKIRLPAPLTETSGVYTRVKLCYASMQGVPAVPVVSTGQRVSAGDLIAEIPDDLLGAPIHTSIQGVVLEINSDSIVIEVS